jgi:broad specificity phosphatase PhoE
VLKNVIGSVSGRSWLRTSPIDDVMIFSDVNKEIWMILSTTMANAVLLLWWLLSHSSLFSLVKAFSILRYEHQHPFASGRHGSSGTSTTAPPGSRRAASTSTIAAATIGTMMMEEHQPSEEEKGLLLLHGVDNDDEPSVSPSRTTNATTTSCRDKKVIYCVRHGQSISNEWMERPGNVWGGVNYNDFGGNTPDAPLSDQGIAQARALTTTEQSLLLGILFDGGGGDCDNDDEAVELVVVSPLTRCLETWSYYYSSLQQTTTTTPAVVVLPLATERVYSWSETGRPKSTLLQAFPLSSSLCSTIHQNNWDWSHVPDHDESWWYTGDGSRSDQQEEEEAEEWRPHGQGQVYAVPGEPEHVFAQRMDALRHWLLHERSERCLLLVTHWGVIRYLSGEQQLEVANGHVARLELSMIP